MNNWWNVKRQVKIEVLGEQSWLSCSPTSHEDKWGCRGTASLFLTLTPDRGHLQTQPTLLPVTEPLLPMTQEDVGAQTMVCNFLEEKIYIVPAGIQTPDLQDLQCLQHTGNDAALAQ